MQLIISIVAVLFQFMPLVGADAEARGREIAEQAVYQVYTIPDTDNKSVLISVPLDEKQNLALYSIPVLRAFTRAALELQEEHIPEDAEEVVFIFMDARHIAGETKLHLIGWVGTNLLCGEDGPFAGYHESFRVADLNVDEDRVPPELIRFVGWLVDWRF